MISLLRKSQNLNWKTTKRTLVIIIALSALSFNSISNAQDKNKTVKVGRETGTKTSGTSVDAEKLINDFTRRESLLRDIWLEYTYTQESRLQVIGPAAIVSGEYYLESEFVFNDAGVRVERILKAPQPTLDRAGLTMTAEDKNAFINLQPFALTAEDKDKYNIKYVGKEKLDELNVYVFDVTPKVMNDEKALKKMKQNHEEGKFFQGRIYVDDQDMQIVKSAGKVVPEFKQRFPKFETYRENIDQRYWFPTYTYGDDLLEFDKFSIPVKMTVKYKNYKRFQSDIKILEDAEIVDDPKTPAKEAPKEQPRKKP